MEQMTVQDLLLASKGRLLWGDSKKHVEHIKLDSREAAPGDLFVPLHGEKVDSHKFIPQVIEAGVACVFTSEHDAVPEELKKETAIIRVDDTIKALQDVGGYMRARLTLPLVGVTGSVGKTTTREMIAAALSAAYRVYKTPGNSNSQVGVPITISEISKEDQVGVIELGMSEPGELTVIAKITRPQIAVITNIGITHIEQLGSRENIYREKMTIQDGLSADGVLILNGDDDMLCRTKGKDGVKTLYYGRGENCDFRAVDIHTLENGMEFTAVHGSERERIVLNVLGEHNVMNAMSAIAVCIELGMTMKQAAEGLLSFTGFKNRQQIHVGKKFTILDDSYNASPASMKASLQVFKTLCPGARHIAVLADMKELGENNLAYHREVGEYAGKIGIDMAVTLGEACHSLAEGIRSVSNIPVHEFLDKKELTKWLEKEVREGDCLLFKGSNSIGLFTIAAEFIAKAD